MDSFEESETLGATPGTGDDRFVNPDLSKLLIMWRNEKYAPEILPFDTEVVENISEVVDFVGETLEEERLESDVQDPNDPDRCLRVLDLDRTKYILRDYLRIRLWKLSQWPQHYLEPRNLALLSEAERNFLRDCWQLKRGFFEHRLLGALPAAKRGLDDKLDHLDMVRRPILDKHVYARITGDVGIIDIPPDFTQETSGSVEPLALHEGQSYLLRYSLIRKFLMEPEHAGKVQLV